MIRKHMRLLNISLLLIIILAGFIQSSPAASSSVPASSRLEQP